MKVAHKLGLSMPGDLSVVGFDDIPLAEQTWPSLTTIRQPLHEMGLAAARLLINRIRGQTRNEKNIVLKSELIIRSSTGPAPINLL